MHGCRIRSAPHRGTLALLSRPAKWSSRTRHSRMRPGALRFLTLLLLLPLLLLLTFAVARPFQRSEEPVLVFAFRSPPQSFRTPIRQYDDNEGQVPHSIIVPRPIGIIRN